jgi:thiol:disulfide interchange protein DsbA
VFVLYNHEKKDMNRRHFLTLTASLATALFDLSTAQAMPFAFEEGVHYKKLPDTARALVAKGTVQEFFFYGCSHCMDMEKPLHEWLNSKPKGVTLEQIPAVFQSPAWSMLARVHYALKSTNQLTSTHAFAFDIFIKDRAKPKNHQDIADLLAIKNTAFDKDAFIKAYESEALNNDVTRAAKLSGQYQLEAVPSFVINGQYVTDLPMAGSHAKLFALIEQLANK